LGGNRKGIARLLIALLATMFLGGLWHGAAWTFVVWGSLHGLALGINHLWRKTKIQLPSLLAWFVTMIFVVFCWVIFRAENFATASTILQSMAGLNGLSMLSSADYKPLVVIVALLMAVIGPASQHVIFEKVAPRPGYAFACTLALIWLLLIIGDNGYSEFIYFQF
jgi:D-alanyl-lipoteichoic acid acyltransferase DltB (MBOAT superfamily)